MIGKHDPSAPMAETWGKAANRYWLPAAVLVLGLASIGMLIGTNWIREQLMIQDIALVHAVGEIQTREATSHLWLEEYVSGDEIHLDEIWENQDRALYLIQAILEGGEIHQDRYSVKALTDPGLRGQALTIRRQIEEFRSIAKRRQEGYERGEDVGIGSAIDIEYDRVFREMLRDLRSLADQVDDHLGRAHARSSVLFRTILFAWVTIVILVVTSLWTRERRRQLAEAALRKSEARLAQAQKLEAVGRLAGGLAHDINNYLAAVTAQCEVCRLTQPSDHDQLSARMDAIIMTASKASALLRRLLAFSRSEPTQPEVVDLNSVVYGLQGMMPRLMGEDVHLDTDLEEGLWNVKIDPSQLEQIIVNLTVNAREAMPTGGQVMIRTANCCIDGKEAKKHRGMEAGDYVLLSIADTGVGVPREIQDEIFEPFFTTKDHATSSGLGLATVYAIVQQSRGIIRLDSEANEGTTFEIYLPRNREQVKKQVTRQALPVAPGSQRILLVEDNEELRVSTREALEILGYSIAVASDGEEALRVFEESDRSIELLITDVVMPGINGRQVMEHLRERKAHLPVIFVSGHTRDVILRHGVMEEGVNFLSKPFTVDTLARKIQEVLGQLPADQSE